jgi:hypothetical protein
MSAPRTSVRLLAATAEARAKLGDEANARDAADGAKDDSCDW